MAMMLIKRGADTNLVAKNNGVSPLWAAVNTMAAAPLLPAAAGDGAAEGHPLTVMQALLDKGANVNHRITSHP